MSDSLIGCAQRAAKTLKEVSALSASLLLFACAPASEPSGRGALSTKPNPLTLPKQTPVNCPHYDPSGIFRYLQLPENKPVYNIFSIALQATAGYEQVAASEDCKRALRNVPQFGADSSFTSAPERSSPLSKPRSVALNWLISKAVAFPGENALLWHYEFPNTYNDVSTNGQAKWSSAFGQAFVLRAFNKAYQDTRSPAYKQYALRAANAFQIPLAQGGFMVPVAKDAWFYEEMPVTPAPFILNGHLVATVALLETYKLYKDPKVLMMAQKGLKAAKALLPRYDLGYWSRYDLNPRKSELYFRIRPVLAAGDGAGIPIHSLTLRDTVNRTAPIYLLPGDSASNPLTGAWRVVGGDWAQAPAMDGRSVLIAVDNSGKYAKSGIPIGGSSFNSYLFTELPTLRFSSNLDVPRFELLLFYKDTTKGSLSVDLRDVRNDKASTFIPLKTTGLLGDQKWKTVVVPVQPRDLPWYVGEAYQHWHIKLLNQLYVLTGDQFYRKYAMRWQCYVDHQHDYDSMQIPRYPATCNSDD